MFYILITAALFYIVALLQASFFSHFDILGTVPNVIFITFVMLAFFDGQKKNNYYNTIVWAFCGGIFLDIFNYPYFGASIGMFIAIGFLIKKMQSSLKEQPDKYPLNHLIIIFLSSFVLYRLVNILLLSISNLSSLNFSFPWGLLVETIYSSAIAVGIFYVIKKILPSLNDRKKLQS